MRLYHRKSFYNDYHPAEPGTVQWLHACILLTVKNGANNEQQQCDRKNHGNESQINGTLYVECVGGCRPFGGEWGTEKHVLIYC